MAVRYLRQFQHVLCKSPLLQMRPPVEADPKSAGLLLSALRLRAHHQTLLARHLATKKSKAKSKGQTPTRLNINSALVEDIVNLGEVKAEMQNVMDNLKEDFNKNLNIRTSPGAFDHITVTTKDGKFPLNQLGQISLKSPQLFLINMGSFPESAAAAMKALRESHMNLNPELDGTILRVPVPQLETQNRKLDLKRMRRIIFADGDVQQGNKGAQGELGKARKTTGKPGQGFSATGSCGGGAGGQEVQERGVRGHHKTGREAGNLT
ncbi:hypothetical protein FKM82_005280 [Ascaphus truei]